MAIEFNCVCGRSFKAKDEHAGMKAKCSSCGNIFEIPRPIPVATSAVTAGEMSLFDLQQGVEEDRLGVTREASSTDLLKVLNAILGELRTSLTRDTTSNSDRRAKEYKVLTQKDKWFSGKFDPEKVEGLLNSYASQGWVFKGVSTASVPGFGGNREEVIIIMER